MLLAVRCALSVAFGWAAGYCATACVRELRARRRPDLPAVVGDAAHLMMNVAMLAMVWAMPSRTAAVWEMTLFAVGAGWFATRFVALSPPRLVCAHHAIGMATMVWMLAAPAVAPAAGGMAAMPGMAGTPPGARPVGLVLGAYFLAAAGLFLAADGLTAGRLAAGGRACPRRRGSVAVHALMSAAMGTAILTLA